MFPLVALGAAALVAVVAASELTGSEKPSKAKETARKDDHPAPLPQSYIVTPIPQGGGRQLSNVESVRNWIF